MRQLPLSVDPIPPLTESSLLGGCSRTTASIFSSRLQANGPEPHKPPAQQPRRFYLAINLRTAKQIGLTIPPEVLVKADKVIK